MTLQGHNAFGSTHRWVYSGFLAEAITYASLSSTASSSYDTDAASRGRFDSGDTVATFDLNELD